MMFKSKKSQFLIFSMLFLILLLLYIYSQETSNPYIIDSGKNQFDISFGYELAVEIPYEELKAIDQDRSDLNGLVDLIEDVYCSYVDILT